jgi:hypothetical protein
MPLVRFTYFCPFKFSFMKKITACMLLLLMAAAFVGCSSGNRMGCPGNPTYQYRGR